MAKFLPAAPTLLFKYTTSPRAAPPPINQASPGAPDYRVEARGTLPNGATLFSFFPHMHLRGKRLEYNLIRKKTSADGKPDDEIEPLLRVHYRFHWQMSYRLAEPRFLRAGTELQAVAWYDNSKANPHNPDADAAVPGASRPTTK